MDKIYICQNLGNHKFGKVIECDVVGIHEQCHNKKLSSKIVDVRDIETKKFHQFKIFKNQLDNDSWLKVDMSNALYWKTTYIISKTREGIKNYMKKMIDDEISKYEDQIKILTSIRNNFFI